MFRIIKHEKGYLVQIQKKKWYGKKYLVCFINYNGYENTFYFKTFENALSELKNEITKHVYRNKK